MINFFSVRLFESGHHGVKWTPKLKITTRFRRDSETGRGRTVFQQHSQLIQVASLNFIFGPKLLILPFLFSSSLFSLSSYWLPICSCPFCSHSRVTHQLMPAVLPSSFFCLSLCTSLLPCRQALSVTVPLSCSLQNITSKWNKNASAIKRDILLL